MVCVRNVFKNKAMLRSLKYMNIFFGGGGDKEPTDLSDNDDDDTVSV